jgi:L-ascorbate metabolism protein UlaG (beta-lactamase superfamily)
MFEVEYKGGNALTVATKKTKIVINPNLSGIGGKDLSVKDAVVLATEADLALRSEETRLVVDGPGEYEISDVSIRGVAIDSYNGEKNLHESTAYRIEIGDVRIAVLGNTVAALSEDQLEAIGIIDMAVVPIGGGGTLNPTEAAQLIRSIDARVVIPVHYADAGLKYPEPQEELDIFVKEFAGEVEQATKYKVKNAAALPQIKTVIELTRS